MKRFLSLAVLCAVLLTLWLPRAAQAESSPVIRVLLRRLFFTDRADLTLLGAYSAEWDGAEAAFQDGAKAVVQIRQGQLYLSSGGVTFRAGSRITFRRHQAASAENGMRIGTGSNLYPGDLTLTISGGALQPVLAVPLEEYLPGVVPYEMNDSFPLEALKAQAICARTYALSHRSPESAWDVTDTTNDQVFRGVNASNTNAARAVRETAGLVAMYQGKLAVCYYGASNGGQTELPKNVWSGRDAPGCYAMTDDPYDLENPESPVKRVRLYRDGTGMPAAFASLLWESMRAEIAGLGFDALDPANFRVDAITAVSLGGRRHASPSRLVTKLNLTLSWSGRMEILPMTPLPGDGEADIWLFGTPAPTEPGVSPTPSMSAFLPAPGRPRSPWTSSPAR